VFERGLLPEATSSAVASGSAYFFLSLLSEREPGTAVTRQAHLPLTSNSTWHAELWLRVSLPLFFSPSPLCRHSTMAGHDAMQVNSSGPQLRSSKAQSSEPSLPRRDSVDGDDTLTRKRPRLDSGSRSKSADRVLSASSQTGLQQDRNFPAEEHEVIGENQATPPNMAQAQQTPNKVTINIRNPQQDLNGDALSDMLVDTEDRRDSHVSPTPIRLSKNGLDSETQEDSILQNGASSPVLISSSPEIEIEIGEPEDLEDESAAVDIRLDGMEGDLVFLMLNKFPYASPDDWVSGAKLYLDHVDSG
jgi:hypothetical protein